MISNHGDRHSPRVVARNELAKLPLGDASMRDAPVVKITEGVEKTPAQFRSFNLSGMDIQNFCSRIELPLPFLLFVEDVGETPCIVIGIVGPDNYNPDRPEEIVYGRRWRVERHLSYSEIYQTVVLACKTALEHEARERLVIKNTTPLNAHQDHEIMADILNNGVLPDPVNFRLSDIIIDGKPLDVKQFHSIGNNKSLLTVDFGYNAKSNLPFLQGEMSILIQDQTDVVDSLWNAMLESGTTWLHENIKLDGQAVFSKSISTGQRIAYSRLHRNNGILESEQIAIDYSRVMNEYIDTIRAPVIEAGPTNSPSMKTLESTNPEHGFRPHMN